MQILILNYGKSVYQNRGGAMSTGIGKYCRICKEQLTFDNGFNYEETLCDDCVELIPAVLRFLADKEYRETK